MKLLINYFQACSQTKWITVYKIYPTSESRLDYVLNIIDTPGFGDTRGIERDNAIVDQLRQFLYSSDEREVSFIDAVCFIVSATDARLTSVQKYIFNSLMSLFGKNIESNICTMITFADGSEPPVLASLVESKLPFGSTFIFNNSALFANEKDLENNALAQLFWQLCYSSFQTFFNFIQDLKTKCLCQTKNVLEKREHLKTVISNILQHESEGFSILAELQEQLEMFKENNNEIENNRNFEYKAVENKQEKIPLTIGQHVTNCLNCKVSCHYNCTIEDNHKKQGCSVMNEEGNCKICPKKCAWSDHKNSRYFFKCVTKTVTKINEKMEKKYEEALQKMLTYEHCIEKTFCDVEELHVKIVSLMNEMKKCKSRLHEIALSPDYLSTVEHIDVMIHFEEIEKQPNYIDRMRMLKEFKKMTLVENIVKNFRDSVKSMKENIVAVTGKSFQNEMLVEEKSQGNIFIRFYKSMELKLF